jgi:hypothetical protein
MKRGFVAGVLVGGLLGLALAPKSGRELREDLGDQSGRFKDRAYDFAGGLKEKGYVAFEQNALVNKVRELCGCEEGHCDCGLVAKEECECESNHVDVVVPPRSK